MPVVSKQYLEVVQLSASPYCCMLGATTVLCCELVLSHSLLEVSNATVEESDPKEVQKGNCVAMELYLIFQTILKHFSLRV